MWICFNDGFVSAVEDKNNPTMLKVRARCREHLEFLKLPVHESSNSDYRYRCFVDKNVFAEAVRLRVADISYPNFKDSVKDEGLHDLYADFWSLHYNFQQRRLRTRNGNSY